MPHIRVRALNESQIASMSRDLPEVLAKTLETDTDNFSFEKIATQFFKNGSAVEGDPMIEVLWFDRGQAAQDECAKIITDYVRKLTPAEYIAVVFTALPKASYYENGAHF